MLSEELLLQYGAVIKSFKKGEVLFEKGEHAKYYYQIISGEVKMNNFNDNGREFIQGIFEVGSSFGEPPLFVDEPYPANAEASSDASIFVLGKENFIKLLKETNEVSLELLKTFSQRLFYKAIIASEMSTENASHRVLRLLDYIKKHSPEKINDGLMHFSITRKEIANLTGLRVETVIRTVKTLEKQGDIQIVNRKILR